MMKTPKLSLISLTATLLTSSLMAGAFDITYDFTASTVPEAPTNISGDVSGTNAAWVGMSGFYGFSTSSDTAFIQSSSSPAERDLGKYLTLSLTPSVSGESLNLTSFSFSLGGSNSGATVNPVVSANVRAGETGSDFSTIPDLVFLPGSVTTATHTITGSTSTFTTYTADLSAAVYQGLDSLVFRIYVFDDANTSSVFDRINDISISGASAIPEASTTVLLAGISAFMCAFMLKRRR